MQISHQAIALLATTCTLVAASGDIESACGADPQQARQQLAAASDLADRGESQRAVDLLTQAIASDAKLAEAYYLRGRENFKLGKIDASVVDFDQYVVLAPDRASQQWERGISLYYAGKFAEGAKQFELYQTFHDNDVENSTWRYLCVARDKGVAAARETLLPIENDTRVPMMEIYALYQGKSTPEKVLEVAKAGDPPAAALNQRLFYAHLYIGLWHEANGDADKAREHIALADKHKIGHYMHDVARIHSVILKKPAEKKP